MTTQPSHTTTAPRTRTTSGVGRSSSSGAATERRTPPVRETVIGDAVAETERWSSFVDTLLHAFERSADAPPHLGARLEALRNKRDTVATKVVALKRHRTGGWNAALKEWLRARREFHDAWRTVISSLDREGLFV